MMFIDSLYLDINVCLDWRSIMLVYPIKTRIITEKDNILDVLLESLTLADMEILDNDIITIAETPLGTTEGRIVKLSDIKVSKEAAKLAKRYELIPEIAQLIIQEADEILGGIPHVILTIKNNTLMANAGIDKSNAPPGYASLLPLNPRASAERLRAEVKKRTGKTIGVMIIDSRTQPLRLGNIGMALGVAGFKPVADDRGRKDLFGNVLRITRRAVADNLASACTAVIGESNESIPAALIRDAPAEFVDESFDSSEMWIPPTECMYMAIFNQWRQGNTS
ncbi:MAG: coenzyme F420-0:L-glutamate ligase [Candidatus Thorarchaeota archaeon]|nr:MAG: coenzyme F420-0:L-glutamate ligase [Candidatus Thorarchaeota archaeon]